MKPIAFALILALAPPSARAIHEDDRRGGPAVIDRGEVLERLDRIDGLLSDAMGRARPKDRAQALRRAREKLGSLREDVGEAPNPREWWRAQGDRDRWFRDEPSPPPAADRREPPAPTPMPDAAVSQLAAALDAQAYPQARLETLQQAARVSFFLVRQAQVLLARFAPGADRAEAIRILSQRIVDRENEYLLTAGAAPQPAPPPAAAPPPAPPSPYGHLPVRASFAARTSLKLQPGLYRGTFSVPGSVTIEGAGREQTVIDGDLVINGPFNTVKGLTVLGKVVITGSQNRLLDVDYRGGVDDRGQLNRY